jgi:YD repeat-containing protein
LSYAQYTTEAELEALLIGRWQRCRAPQIAGEDVGVEFTADGRYWALTWDASHQVVRQVGIDYGGTWTYYPPGSPDPISHQPSTTGLLDLGGVITDPPTITNDPRQLRIQFSPVQSVYVPLTAG